MKYYCYYKYSLLAVLLVLLSGCNHKDLYMVDSRLVKVWVDFDFEKLEATPTAMRVLFYPIEGNGTTGTPYVFDVAGTGGYANVPEGDFKVLAYNVDTENILEQEENYFNLFRLTTASSEVEMDPEEVGEGREASFARSIFGAQLPRSAEEGEFLLYEEPEYTCRCFTPMFHVDPTISVVIDSYGNTEKVATSKDKLNMVAEQAVCTLKFDVKGIEGLVRANYVRATLSGVSASYQMGEGHYTDEEGMVAFECQIDVPNDVVHGKVHIWGFKPYDKPDSRQFLNVYIWATGGNFYFTQEVTDELTEAVKEAEISKEFSFELTTDLDITQGVVGNSGFEPTVGEWDEENRDIAL